MNSQSILSQFLSPQNMHSALFVNQSSTISKKLFLQHVTALTHNINTSSHNKYCLYCQDIFLFAVGFFALLQAKKEIIILPNIQPGTLANLPNISDAILSDSHLDLPNFKFLHLSKDPKISQDITPLEKINSSHKISFFTSGSTGNPKLINKTLLNIEAEINTLEELWGSRLDKNTIFASSVSHQHIYGFLFNMMWPISQGNTIYQTPISTTENLCSIADIYKMILISSPAFLKRLDVDQKVNAHNIVGTFSSGGLLKHADAKTASLMFNDYPTEILGSTETGGVAWRNQEKEEIWNILPQVHIKLIDDYQITVKSPHIHQKNHIKMGDAGELVSHNQLILHGRIDKIVKIEEKRVSLVQVENTLLEHEYIDNCYCTIFETNRQNICVTLTLSITGKNFLEKNKKFILNRLLRNHLAQCFEPVTLPRKWHYVDKIEVNSEGKILNQNIEHVRN